MCLKRTQYAAPMGLKNFLFVILQRFRAYGAGKDVVATVLFAESMLSRNQVAFKRLLIRTTGNVSSPDIGTS